MPRNRTPEHLAFGQSLRRLRAERGWSQEQLGYQAKLHRNYIGGVERGDLNPTLTSIFKLARAFETKPSKLLALTEEELAARS